MPLHLAAFAESVAPITALQTFTAVREQTLHTEGDDLWVPGTLANVVGAAALCAAAATRAQLQSPSLRILANLDVEPLIPSAVVFGSPPESVYHPEAAIPLAADEALNFAIDAPAGAAALHYGLVWLSDGAMEPVTGRVFMVRATATITQTTTTWENGNLTFAQTLPAGRYAVVGMRCVSADAVAARLVFPEQMHRPGVMVVNAVSDHDPYWFRVGRTGVFGEFPHTTPPTLDILGGAAAAQSVILDMVRVG